PHARAVHFAGALLLPLNRVDDPIARHRLVVFGVMAILLVLGHAGIAARHLYLDANANRLLGTARRPMRDIYHDATSYDPVVKTLQPADAFPDQSFQVG